MRLLIIVLGAALCPCCGLQARHRVKLMAHRGGAQEILARIECQVVCAVPQVEVIKLRHLCRAPVSEPSCLRTLIPHDLSAVVDFRLRVNDLGFRD